MKKQARLHHFIPQFYLRGFSRSGSKNSKVCVIDLERKSQYETAIKNIGAERDFNRVDLSGHAPDALEAAYANFEGQVAQAVRNIEKTLRFEGDDRALVLNLIALLAVRHPRIRSQLADFQADITKKMLLMTLATEGRWEATKTRMRADGIPIDDRVTRDMLRDGLINDRYEIVIPTTRHVRSEFVMFEAALPTMFHRGWRLFVANNLSGPFVSGENPVSLIWKKPHLVPPLYRDSPGFGRPETQLVFPLTQNLALIGEFEDEGDVVLPSTRELVALINRRTIMFSHQVYAPRLSFFYRNAMKTISTGSMLLAEASRRKAPEGD